MTAKDYRQRKGQLGGSLMESGLITATRAGSAGSVAAVTNTLVDVVKTRIILSAAGDDSCADTAKKVERA